MEKYQSCESVQMKNREWPDKQILKAPIWCSVDLGDGNQALPIPMNIQQKADYFKLLLNIGFKEIELGFPSASFPCKVVCPFFFNFLPPISQEF